MNVTIRAEDGSGYALTDEELAILSPTALGVLVLSAAAGRMVDPAELGVLQRLVIADNEHNGRLQVAHELSEFLGREVRW